MACVLACMQPLIEVKLIRTALAAIRKSIVTSQTRLMTGNAFPTDAIIFHRLWQIRPVLAALLAALLVAEEPRRAVLAFNAFSENIVLEIALRAIG